MAENAFSSIPSGARNFILAIVVAQVLTQIGAFTLPALLPDFIARWSLSNTEAGWVVGVFFAAYVPAVPVLLALTDRLPTRRIYLLGTGCTALAHLGVAFFAEGFWNNTCILTSAGDTYLDIGDCAADATLANRVILGNNRIMSPGGSAAPVNCGKSYAFADWIKLGLDVGTTLSDIPPTPQIMDMARAVLSIPS